MSVRIKKEFYKLLHGCNSASIKRKDISTGLKLLNFQHERRQIPLKKQEQGFCRREFSVSI
jgi:hypothetical protein